jgi:hypothetical protein
MSEVTSKRQWQGSIYFGGLFAVFLMGAFCFTHGEIEPWKVRLIALFSALLAGLFGYFVVGTLAIGGKLPWLTMPVIKATGGFALFVVTLFFFYSPASPIRMAEQRTFRETLSIASTNSDVHGPKSIDPYEVQVPPENQVYNEPVANIRIDANETIEDVHIEPTSHVGDYASFNSLNVVKDGDRSLRLIASTRVPKDCQGCYLTIRIYGTVRKG